MSKSLPKSDGFRIVNELGCSLPDVEAATQYDGSPMLKVNGAFMAGLAMHQSAEPDTLVLRVRIEERPGLLEDAPEIYYLTEYYKRFPVVLVRLRAATPEVLRELLAVAWRITSAKSRKRPLGVTARDHATVSNRTGSRRFSRRSS